jgi:Flp pilus assembly protein TadG
MTDLFAMRWIRQIARDARGTAVTEFVIVAPLFLALFIGILEISLQFFFAADAEKAAQIGVRTAVVVTPPAGVPATNDSPTANWGAPCAPTSDPCSGFATKTCTGTACGGGFSTILARMQVMFPAIQAANVTLTYDYVALGFAGGPAVPAVTVTITGLSWPAGPFAAVLGLLGGTPGAATLPTIRATLTGEDITT